MKKIWNASRICVSSLRRGHANLLCIVPILVYVLREQYTNSWIPFLYIPYLLGIFLFGRCWAYSELKHSILKAGAKRTSQNRQFVVIKRILDHFSRLCQNYGHFVLHAKINSQAPFNKLNSTQVTT